MFIKFDMNNGHVNFFPKFKAVTHELIYVKNIFLSSNLKNDNGDITMRDFFCYTNKTKDSIKFKKG